MSHRPIDLDVQPGTVERRFSSAEATDLANAWLDAFGADRKGIHVDQFLWHVFSYERTPCIQGARAVEAYRNAAATTFIVLANDQRSAVSTRVRPESSTVQDWYVFPPNLAWTMAFTHETGWCGPYFARHPDFEHLDEINQRAVEKALEAAEAKRRGWW